MQGQLNEVLDHIDQLASSLYGLAEQQGKLCMTWNVYQTMKEVTALNSLHKRINTLLNYELNKR